MKITRRSAILISLAGLVTPAFAATPQVFANKGIAINGYDSVAYFTESKPVKGSSTFTTDWHGATWLFSTAANRDLFKSNPEKYAPQFGGYCAYALSKGSIAPTVPEAWTVYQGKLYLNFSLRARELWKQDIPGNIAKAKGHWPGILE